MNYKQAEELVNFVEIIAEKEKPRQLSPPASLLRFFILWFNREIANALV